MFRVAFASAGAYVAYPIVDNKIKFYCHDNPKNKEIIQNCPSLKDEIFQPTPWLSSGLLQSYYGCAATPEEKDCECNFERELFTLKDGGTLGLDWARNGDKKILVIAPGLTGGSESIYVRNITMIAVEQGYSVVVVHGRGLNGTPLTTPLPNCLGNTKDFAQAVEHIKNSCPDAHIVGVGFSMGANLLLKYLGETGENCPLKAGAAVSTPFDIVICSRYLRKPWPTSYIADNFLVTTILDSLKPNIQVLEPLKELGVDLEETLKSTRSWDYDSRITCKILGFQNPEQYYRQVSCVNYLEKIKVPVLALSSLDDPVVTKDCIPYEEFKSNPNLILATTRAGGHIGWFTGVKAPQRWYSYPVVEFLETVLENN